MQIYLDYSATTPPRSEVIERMQQVMQEQWGNPSSLHQWGQRSAVVLEQARMQVAALLGASPESIVFTSGGTESNNFAILGVTRQYRQPQHLIISSVEHSAISEPVQWLEQQGWQVTRLPVDSLGRVNPADLQAALRPNTVLVSIIYGQSEVGTVQPIEALGEIVRAHGAIFHTDAVQVAGRLPIQVAQLPVDLLSVSSHKLYGPQGVGALYVRPGIDLVPLLTGGGQEFRLRSGTQPVPLIAGFGLAAELAAADLLTESLRLIRLRDRLFDQLAEVADLTPTGDRLHRLPHHVSFYWRSGDGERLSGKTLVRQMNLAGIAISAGSACHSGKLVPSPVLSAMGLNDRAAKSGIRLTLGRLTAEADIDWTALVLKQILDRLTPLPTLSICHSL
ncbi:cysteine desulfurase family protein [Leptolyngbya sp. FACHB-711]|uniref:cysteine desulfurase family protein n=1 Tax=unclassified Leptolyngbya TaxID=2650499 RepID=UPI001684AC99|nr:cysteine desulfurase family protein [Leptolyngbya sp. FACHB-711]MBD1853576.1 cysteine desulfurase [Cyanobacteria bacterium FACHB-502]MBD2023189.1 cysteine desulfurase [Leptolyngbya sp. FACHB-711]